MRNCKTDFSEAAAKVKAKYFTANVNLYKKQAHPAYSGVLLLSDPYIKII